VPEPVAELPISAVLRIAALHAAAIVRRHGLPADAHLDLQQEGCLELWRKKTRFDSRRASWPTFCDRVISNQLRSLMRRERAVRRARGIESPLDELKYSHSEPGDPILRLDILRVLDRVSNFDRAVALSLAHNSVVETSHLLGSSRVTVYRAIERLRLAFRIAGFHLMNHSGARARPPAVRCDDISKPRASD
jgi:RNA polymerase sigma factor (sigma-70 family)